MINNDILYALISGLILILFSYMAKMYLRSIIHPGVVFGLVWGAGLILVSAAKLFNIYTVESFTLLIFIFGAFIFLFSSLLVTYLFKEIKVVDRGNEFRSINYSSLGFFYLVLTLVSMPFIVSSIMSQGDNFVEIAYNLRVSALNNEPVLPSIFYYYFVLSLSLSLIMLCGVFQKRFKISYFIILFIPFIFTMLLINGRSGLVSLILSWLFAYLFFGGKLSVKVILYFLVLLFLIIFLGAIFVSKVDIENLSFVEVFFVIIEHILDYYLQGIVLFDLYMTGKIHVSENWDALNVACQILANFGICEPLPQHQDVVQFGEGKLGNVYSIYFSIYPKYGLFGVLFFMFLYGVISAYFYEIAKKGFIYSYVISCFIFSFIVLSLFHDGFGYSLILFIQTLFFVYMIIFFFGKKRF